MGSTAQFGLVCFVIFFIFSQVFEWASEVKLPLPFFILAGAILAIASNLDRRAGFPFNLLNTITPSEESSIPTEPPTISQSQTQKFPREVSFTIRKPEKQD
ncbi:MAG: hypothetical protein MUC48_15285 [Leptolyngbya sp. Prado105]|jgi:hypothetical protein|nr:hypothetical protein [Leptolyngbya sp. Prado105]